MSVHTRLQALIDVRRHEWGARPHPRPHTPVTHDHIEWHHAVQPAGWDWLTHTTRIEDEHLGRGWNGPWYNLGVDLEWGTVVELRGLGNQSQSSALTVVLYGNFDAGDRLTPAAIETMRRLLAVLPDNQTTHRARAMGTKYASACPGRHAIPIIEQLTPWEDDDMPLDDHDLDRIAERVEHRLNDRWSLWRDPDRKEDGPRSVGADLRDVRLALRTFGRRLGLPLRHDGDVPPDIRA